MPTPCVNIFWDEKENKYAVQYQAAAPQGGSADFGQPIIVPGDEFESRIGELVLKGLETYANNSPQSQESINKSGADREFYKRNKLVSVAKAPTNNIIVNPCEHRGVLYGGVIGAGRDLGPTPTKEELQQALRNAFRLAR